MGPKLYVRSGCVDFSAATICQLLHQVLLPQLCIRFDEYEALQHVGRLIFRNGPLIPLGRRSEEDRP